MQENTNHKNACKGDVSKWDALPRLVEQNSMNVQENSYRSPGIKFAEASKYGSNNIIQHQQHHQRSLTNHFLPYSNNASDETKKTAPFNPNSCSRQENQNVYQEAALVTLVGAPFEAVSNSNLISKICRDLYLLSFFCNLGPQESYLGPDQDRLDTISEQG